MFFDRFSLIVRVNVFKGAVGFALKEMIILAKKSKKEKAAGREKHRQMQRAKKMQKKQKKNVSLPTKHKKK